MDYSAQRTRNLFSSTNDKPYKLSRSKINDYLKCKRCFYLDRKCGTGQPPPYGYSLNIAVDSLLKKEFDQYRADGKAHPLLIEHGIDAIPFSHLSLEDWRMNQRGIQHLHESTNLLIYGAIDDIWVKPDGELLIVDYKATSTKSGITLENRESYKRQMEIYQWLFRRNGFKVSNTSYFVYCNGDTEKDNFTNMLQFKISLIPYEGNDSWMENTIIAIKNCLNGNTLPEYSETCEYCRYWKAIRNHVEDLKGQNFLIKILNNLKKIKFWN